MTRRIIFALALVLCALSVTAPASSGGVTRRAVVRALAGLDGYQNGVRLTAGQSPAQYGKRPPLTLILDGQDIAIVVMRGGQSRVITALEIWDALAPGR